MKLGVIGGSGLYDMEELSTLESIRLETPFGSPSDDIARGRLDDTEVFFLPRHGRGHVLLPSEIRHRANIFAFKTLGVTHIVSISAVGSLKEEIAPRDVVIIDQYCDRTKSSAEHSFFGDGIVSHIAFADPVCPQLSLLAFKAVSEAVAGLPADSRPNVRLGGAYLNMEGPAFSTRAESNIYRTWGLDVIGMTNLPEAKLARESEICFCSIAMVTDYDCWHPKHEAVTVDIIIANLNANAALAKRIIAKIASSLPGLARACACPDALASSIITNPEAVSESVRARLKPIIGKYLPPSDAAKDA